ncbi:phage holin family protein [Actinocorallia sp. A-T 12471]|uniref:phage holin family protein n=1 Tax=Actinocorallia sp. A-T 12471 TaxID=3089813 RepID=UPI0029D04E3D|nr:phage holin family protein [Actinocorallia sp. A-T 12471]MDX6742022.1 phage holin family protein [Actinocorallia sp. A-T 12471]
MKILINAVITALALAAATWLLDGIEVAGSDTQERALTLVLVALIFGVVNAVLKPIIKTLGCAFYVLTLGLFGLVVNALLLLLTSYIATELDLAFHVDGFVTALLGGIIVAIVSWALSLVLDND